MTLHYELRRAFLRGGAQAEVDPAQGMPLLQQDGFACRLCDKVFASSRALQAPLRGVHMVKATAERLFMSSTPPHHCPVMLAVFLGLSIDYKSICGLADVNLLDAMSA